MQSKTKDYGTLKSKRKVKAVSLSMDPKVYEKFNRIPQGLRSAFVGYLLGKATKEDFEAFRAQI